MQHRDMLPFLITQVIENEGNGKSHFSVSVSKNATEGIFRGYYKGTSDLIRMSNDFLLWESLNE